jgi:hypothetical protein
MPIAPASPGRGGAGEPVVDGFPEPSFRDRRDGDLYAGLKIVLPPGGDPDLESLMRFWRDQKPYKLREE